MGLLRSLTEVGGAGREESWVDGPVSPFTSVLAKYWLTIVLGVQALAACGYLTLCSISLRTGRARRMTRQSHIFSHFVLGLSVNVFCL